MSPQVYFIPVDHLCYGEKDAFQTFWMKLGGSDIKTETLNIKMGIWVNQLEINQLSKPRPENPINVRIVKTKSLGQ